VALGFIFSYLGGSLKIPHFQNQNILPQDQLSEITPSVALNSSKRNTALSYALLE